MAATQDSSFGAFLRQLRTDAELTQEELAERAQLSVRGVSDLERGVNTRPRPYTLTRLADSLDLGPENRARFERAAAAAARSESATEALPHGQFLGAIPDGRLLARDDEMVRIGSVLDVVTEGSGHLLFLSGGAGSGKTRLLQELTVGARERGYVVLTGVCFPNQQPTAYRPVVEALSELPIKVPVAARAEAERRWKAIQPLVGGASRGNGEVRAGTPVHQHIGSAVTDLLLQTSHSAPLSLVLDDLQWADEESLQLIQHLARVTRSSRILLAGAFCDDDLTEKHPVFSRMLQVMTHDRLAECIPVRRLSPEETNIFIASFMGQDASGEEFTTFVYRRTKGNPRLIEAMVWSLGGRLELQREIGAGSTGRVFRAFDRRTDMEVAAKLVLAREGIEIEDLLRFQQEGKILAALHHPNIVHVYDTFAEEHAACIIMELLDGPSLATILQQGTIPLSQAKLIGLQVARALSYAHSRGIVHRDIKPDNVMVLAGNEVKVTDFGIARILRTDNSLATIATTGMRAGTPSYMAPEQIAGRETDGRADVYALGAMLFHMVGGRPPFEGADKLAIAVKHLQDRPVAPSSLDPEIPLDWDALILKALQKEPSRRFQTAGELEAAISALGEKRTRANIERPAGTRATAAIVGIAAVLAVTVFMLLHFTMPSHSPSAGDRINAYLAGTAGAHRFSGTALVADRGRILLDKGYGLANRETHTLARASTEYPVPGVTALLSITGLMQAVNNLGGGFGWARHICRYLPNVCPPSWRPITIGMLLNGTANLPHTDAMGKAGSNPDQSMAYCETEALDGQPGSKVDYENCGDLAMSLVLARVLNNPWGGALSGTGGVLGQAGMSRTGQITDALAASSRVIAKSYDGSAAMPSAVYNDDIVAYSTAADAYEFDNAFFGAKLLSRRQTSASLVPRGSFPDTGCCALANQGVARPQWGYEWKTGLVFGRRVYYTFRGKNDFQTINMRFPKDRLTIVLMSNDLSNDAFGITLHTAGIVLNNHSRPAPRSGIASGLLGTYRRTFGVADSLAADDSALHNWVGGTLFMRIKSRWIDFGVPGSPVGAVDEYYNAASSGALTLLGYTPTNGSSMCTDIPTETPPYGHYRWARHGKMLFVTRAAPDPCFDRRGIVPGRWTKVG